MSTAPTPPGTAIAAIALTGPSSCIAFTSGTALTTVKENARPKYRPAINFDFIEFSSSGEKENFQPALQELQSASATKGPAQFLRPTSVWASSRASRLKLVSQFET